MSTSKIGTLSGSKHISDKDLGSQQLMHLNIENVSSYHSARKSNPHLEHSSARRVPPNKIKDAISRDFDKMTDVSIRKDKKSSRGDKSSVM
jgi:hypothetical protein